MPNCSRRRLLQMTGMLTAGHAAQALAKPFTAFPHAPGLLHRGTRLYATLSASASQPSGVGTFFWSGEAWECQSFLPALNVGPLLADAGGEHLFAAHSAADSRMPSGFVETLHIDSRSGSLSRGQRQSLALASRVPIAMALSADRRLLAVVATGGVFSILPVQADGSVAEVSAAYKQLALPMSAQTAVSLSFRSVGGPGSLTMRTSAPVLTLQTNSRCLEYECRTDGLTHIETRETESHSPAAATPNLPEGTRSFVLLPPLQV